MAYHTVETMGEKMDLALIATEGVFYGRIFFC